MDVLDLCLVYVVRIIDGFKTEYLAHMETHNFKVPAKGKMSFYETLLDLVIIEPYNLQRFYYEKWKKPFHVNRKLKI